MTTKLDKHEINPGYEHLFSFENENEKLEHKAQMISFRVLSEVEKICDEKNIKKKDLAEMVGTSRSYITQLFRGSKQINTSIMAKFEEALEMCFEIRIRLNDETETDFVGKQLTMDILQNERIKGNNCVWFQYHPPTRLPQQDLEAKKNSKDTRNKAA